LKTLRNKAQFKARWKNHSLCDGFSLYAAQQIKRQAEALFSDLGMNMATALTIFTKAAVRQGKIPFEITADLFLTKRINPIYAPQLNERSGQAEQNMS
jgi:addiction module RelB/DinJ family antitoxin